MQSTYYSCQVLIEHIFSTDFRKKYSNTKFRDNPSSGSRDISFGQTDGHDEANSIFFRNFDTGLKFYDRKTEQKNENYSETMCIVTVLL